MIPKNSLFKPHLLQFYLLLFYTATVVLGSAYGLVYWAIGRPSRSYFSEKSNLVNVLLVKNGWFWTSLLFGLISAKVIYPNQQEQLAKAAMRWTFATLYWYFVTQWFFGPSLLDRVFVSTGGECLMQPDVYQAAACKKSGGEWIGGHDVSGHCVLLIHASLLLWEEFSIIVYRLRDFRTVLDTKHKLLKWCFIALVFTWWWMLLMTATYFHNFREKLTGTIFGILYWALMYVVVFPNYLKDWMPFPTLQA